MDETNAEITVEELVAAMLDESLLTDEEIEEQFTEVEPDESRGILYIPLRMPDEEVGTEPDELSPLRDDDGTGVADD